MRCIGIFAAKLPSCVNNCGSVSLGVYSASDELFKALIHPLVRDALRSLIIQAVYHVMCI